ncbi:MAG: fatty acid desaturase [Sphingomonadaceae bacterium]|jgi:fatty acid desaturase|nr:fatty acid desaturase [Sphingomonadaceae bacterium]
MTAHEAIADTTKGTARGAGIADDMAMLRAAVEQTRDISAAKGSIYWPDMLVSAALGYAGLAGAILLPVTWQAVLAGVVSALAFYRALLFIHELTHIHRDALPGFRFGWNLLVGIPMLTPSLMYENVHTLHHARTRYGTVEDPEYLPLALMKPWSLPLFIVVAVLLPIGLLIRSAVLVPLGVIVPPLRRLVWERASALSINPEFRRRPAEGDFARQVFWQELGASVWALFLVWYAAVHDWRPLAIGLTVISATAVLNQVRTLVAHLWQNEGEPMTVTAQFLDSVNVPPPGLLAELWAPVGLRYHALHHLLPSLPYHALPEAHRRLAKQLGTDSTYARASYPGLLPLVGYLAKNTMKAR